MSASVAVPLVVAVLRTRLTPKAAAGFAARWEARWHPAGALGHINSAGGLGSWEQGRALLDSLTRH
ncbi:alpha/beta hydrolase [Streptomyces sp. DHE17-7]|uniref:alpha/beta hydrolase n=1 Tax=Streptomyces sp. DHE17-7 TaxID=2759949 RepID=UPI0022EA17DD|nr:alpha/beta hydrolase [Streptomyces sp. DHE17-7]